MDKKPLIGLLCSNISTEAYKNIDIEPPIELMQFTPEDINWNDKRISGLILENGVWKKESEIFRLLFITAAIPGQQE